MFFKKILHIIAAIIICSICVEKIYCQSKNDSAVNAEQLIRIEQNLMDAIALGDTSVWSKHLDKNFFVVTEDGTRFTREDFLAGFQPLPNGFSGNIKVTQPDIAFHDNIAIVAYVADEHETVYGQQLHTTYGTLDTYYKTDTSWMMLASEVYEIPQLPKSIKVNAKILQQYTGVYNLNDTISCTVSYERDTLFMQKKNGSKQALFAETNNVFFKLNDTRGRKIFTKGDDGNILMLERRNGQDLVWKKVKQ